MWRSCKRTSMWLCHSERQMGLSISIKMSISMCIFPCVFSQTQAAASWSKASSMLLQHNPYVGICKDPAMQRWDKARLAQKGMGRLFASFRGMKGLKCQAWLRQGDFCQSWLRTPHSERCAQYCPEVHSNWTTINGCNDLVLLLRTVLQDDIAHVSQQEGG